MLTSDLLYKKKHIQISCVVSILRNCGNVFCKDCCHLKLPIPDQQLYDPVLVCNTCHDLLLESRTREIRSQQLKKAIATASSWEKRRVAWPASALSCSFWTDEPSAPLWPRPAVVLAAGGGKMRRNCYSLGGSVWERRCTVRLSERRRGRGKSEKEACQRGGVGQTPSVQRHFQPGALRRPAASTRLSPLVASCPRHTSNPSTPAESPTFSTKHLHPPHRHCLALQRTIAHPSTCRGLQSLYLYYWRLSTLKRKEIAATVFKSLILYSYFVHY